MGQLLRIFLLLPILPLSIQVIQDCTTLKTVAFGSDKNIINFSIDCLKNVAPIKCNATWKVIQDIKQIVIHAELSYQTQKRQFVFYNITADICDFLKGKNMNIFINNVLTDMRLKYNITLECPLRKGNTGALTDYVENRDPIIPLMSSRGLLKDKTLIMIPDGGKHRTILWWTLFLKVDPARNRKGC